MSGLQRRDDPQRQTVNTARPSAYLCELSQSWRCWSPSCEVVSETLSLTHITGQCCITHIQAWRSTHPHAHTQIHIHTHKVEIRQITLPISCVLICLLLFFLTALHNMSPHVSMLILVPIELARWQKKKWWKMHSTALCEWRFLNE